MPPPEEMDLNQDAVLWPFNGIDDSGEPSVGPPQAVAVRWEDKRSQSVSETGTVLALDAQVKVGLEVALGSHIWKGRLADFTDADTNEIMVVQTYSEIPDLKGRGVTRVVGLSFLRNSPAASPLLSPRKQGGRKKPATKRRAARGGKGGKRGVVNPPADRPPADRPPGQ